MRTITLKQIIESTSDPLFIGEYQEYGLTKEQFLKFTHLFAAEFWFHNIGFETVDMFKHRLHILTMRLGPRYRMALDAIEGIQVELMRGAGQKTITTQEHGETVQDTGSSQGTSESQSSGSTESSSENAQINVVQDHAYRSTPTFDSIQHAQKETNDSSADSGYSDTSSGESESSFENNKNIERNVSIISEVLNTEIPLHEAINDILKVETDLLYRMLDEMTVLFSFHYY